MHVCVHAPKTKHAPNIPKMKTSINSKNKKDTLTQYISFLVKAHHTSIRGVLTRSFLNENEKILIQYMTHTN